VNAEQQKRRGHKPQVYETKRHVFYFKRFAMSSLRRIESLRDPSFAFAFSISARKEIYNLMDVLLCPLCPAPHPIDKSKLTVV
jgi:hypothetical protein